MKFNTVYGELHCPNCNHKVLSGVGFRFGAVGNFQYRVGDKLAWTGAPTRPNVKPKERIVKTVGYFNCDNVKCETWQDCFPQVQRALVTIEENVIKSIAPFDGEASDHGFDIIEPKHLS